MSWMVWCFECGCCLHFFFFFFFFFLCFWSVFIPLFVLVSSWSCAALSQGPVHHAPAGAEGGYGRLVFRRVGGGREDGGMVSLVLGAALAPCARRLAGLLFLLQSAHALLLLIRLLLGVRSQAGERRAASLRAHDGVSQGLSRHLRLQAVRLFASRSSRRRNRRRFCRDGNFGQMLHAGRSSRIGSLQNSLRGAFQKTGRSSRKKVIICFPKKKKKFFKKKMQG
jgi:hypothetical protein